MEADKDNDSIEDADDHVDENKDKDADDYADDNRGEDADDNIDINKDPDAMANNDEEGHGQVIESSGIEQGGLRW